MILVHFFTRVIKRKTYLLADSSATVGTSPLWDTPEILFEVDPTEDRVNWIPRAVKKITDAHPNLDIESKKVFKPRKRKGSAQMFDITFQERTT